MFKQKKIIFGVVIAALSIFSFVFVLKGKMNIAVLGVTLLFSLTNGYRAMTFNEKGYKKEARWMLAVAIFFLVIFIAMLFIV